MSKNNDIMDEFDDEKLDKSLKELDSALDHLEQVLIRLENPVDNKKTSDLSS